MKFNLSSSLLAVSTLTLLTNALPLSGSPNESQIAKRKLPYSVVPVDGGQLDGMGQSMTQVVTKDSTQTVTESPKTIPPVTETKLSTTIVTISESPTTFIPTITTTSTPVTTQVPAPKVSSSISSNVATVTSTVSSADTVTIISTPTATPYDNGMWHTTYYKAAAISSSSEKTSSEVGDRRPSPAIDVDSNTFTGAPSNGTYALMPRGRNNLQPFNTTTTGTIFISSSMAAMYTKPPMPTLPKTSEVANPAEVPPIDVAKHMVPGFGSPRMRKGQIVSRQV